MLKNIKNIARTKVCGGSGTGAGDAHLFGSRFVSTRPSTPTNNMTGGVMPVHAPMEDST
jgi:hypothetical protein